MEFEKIKRDNEVLHQITFSADEATIISAVYSEVINRRIMSGNPSSISDHDKRVARAYNSSDGIKITFRSLEKLHRNIQTFVDSTDSEALELAEVYPPYKNHDAIERIEYGKDAEKMLDELQKHLGVEHQNLPPLPDTWEVPDRPPKDLF